MYRNKILDEVYNEYSGQIVYRITPKDMPSIKDERKAIKDSFQNPIGTEKLDALAKDKKNVLILADDITRVTPKDRIIPVLLDELNQAGISDENITILIALGTHRYMTEEEIEKSFGKEVTERVKILNHEWMNKNTFVYLGKTINGTPIYVNKLVVASDLVIGVGNIIPHLYAGYSGGAKIIQPGVCNEETTAATHLLVFKNDNPLELIGNPDNWVRLEMEEVAKKAGLDFIVNVVINTKKELIGVFSGDFIKAHRRGVRLCEKIYKRQIPQLSDITLVSSQPADIDYWQAIKGVTSAVKGTKPGGTIILLTPCSEGISPVHKVLEDYGGLRYIEVKEKLKNGEFSDLVGVATLLLHAYILDRYKVIVVSEGLNSKMCKKLRMLHAENIDEALKLSFAYEGKDAKMGLIYYGGEVFPSLY